MRVYPHHRFLQTAQLARVKMKSAIAFVLVLVLKGYAAATQSVSNSIYGQDYKPRREQFTLQGKGEPATSNDEIRRHSIEHVYVRTANANYATFLLL